MKAPSGPHPLRRLVVNSNDWKLTKACPRTLMLVRPHPWRTVPRFAALVDVSEAGTAQFAQTIVHASEYFALGCHAELDIVYGEASEDSREKSERLANLERLAREYHVETSHVHVLSGDPDQTVPEFAARQNYDAVVLGARTHRKGIAGVRGMLTSKIVDAVDCDLILVEPVDRDLSDPGADIEPHAERVLPEDPVAAMQNTATSTSVLWQSMFGD
jgi:universal stress protein E